jgi:WD40 repeat protein
MNKNLFISTGVKDGVLAIHDMRTHQPVKKERVHQGAINFLDTSLSSFIVTGSADKTVKKFDIISGFKQMASMPTTDAVFCGKIINNNLAITGCGDGNILAFDLDKDQCIYGYGADQMGAVHCMAVTEDMSSLITGGDSG